MSLPLYHVPRPQLCDVLIAHRLSVIVAGAGFGKSLLAAEMGERYDAPRVSAVLEPGAGSASSVAARLRDDARRSGLSDIAAAMEPSDPQLRTAAMMAAFDGQRVVIVVDEAQHLEPDAVALLDALLDDANTDARVLLIGRTEPPEVAALRARHLTAVLGVNELSLTVDEVAHLLEAFDLQGGSALAETVHETTAGWVAAVVLVASRARVAGIATIDPAAASRQRLLPMLVDEILHALPRRTELALVQLAHLPFLDAALCTEAAQIEELLPDARRAGLPLVSGPGRWMQLIGPVQDDLRRRGALRPAFARRAAASYHRRGLPEVAIDLLLTAGDADAAASLVAGLDQPTIETIDLPRLVELVEALPDRVVASHPRVLLQVARACEPTAATRRRGAALTRGVELAQSAGDHRLVRELEAELARDIVRDNGNIEAERIARRALESTAPDEEITRARLFDALGQVAGWQRDDIHLEQARDRMTLAAQIYRAHGQRGWLAQIMMPLAVYVHAARGDYDSSIQCFDEALALIPESRPRRGVALTFRAEVLQDIGRFAEADLNAIEALTIADATNDVRVRAYAHWTLARTAALTGDVAALWRELSEVEANRGDWFDQSGCNFLAFAADMLDHVDEVEPALEYLARAQQHPEPDRPALVSAEAALLARHGDPQQAEQAITAMIAASWFEPRERWHASLLRAFAAMRRGDTAAADLAVVAFEQAAELGNPQLPLVRERTLAEQLLTLTAGHARLPAVSFEPADLPVTVSLLGAFMIDRGGRTLDVAVGQSRQLIKVIAAGGGRMLAESAVELLWPETDPEVGANRLRTVLGRLRDSVGDVVIREERMLCLGPRVEVDASRFETNARRALALVGTDPASAVSVARGALAAYRGDLLPDDPYESWAIGPRERIRRRAVSLLDLCAARAAADLDLDEAIRCLDRAIEILPDEEERYLTAARHQLAQGRRGAARSTVRRARQMLDELGLSVPPAMRDLERKLAV